MHIIHDEFKCDNCDESFRRIDSLKRHIRKIHTNNEKIKCDSCDQNFRRKESLKQHMKTCSVNEPLLDEEQAQPVKPLRKVIREKGKGTRNKKERNYHYYVSLFDMPL